MAHGLFPSGLAGSAAPGEMVEPAIGELAAGQRPVGVVTVAQQCLEPAGLPVDGGGEFVAGAQQHPH